MLLAEGGFVATTESETSAVADRLTVYWQATEAAGQAVDVSQDDSPAFDATAAKAHQLGNAD